jgi:DedD protein
MADTADINVDDLRRRARRRLVGAIVLAIAAAVVVPMLLESDPKPLGEDVSIKIPQVDEGKFVNRLNESKAKSDAPATSDAAAKKSIADAEKSVMAPTTKPPKYDTAVTTDKATVSSAEPTPPAPPAAQATAPPQPAPAPAEPAVIAKAEPRTVPAPTPPSPETSVARAETSKEGFAVQLAAFSDDKGANALASRLKKSGYPAYTEPLKTSRGTLWRVRVGPYPSRDAAGGVRDKLKSEGQNGIVAPAR